MSAEQMQRRNPGLRSPEAESVVRVALDSDVRDVLLRSLVTTDAELRGEAFLDGLRQRGLPRSVSRLVAASCLSAFPSFDAFFNDDGFSGLLVDFVHRSVFRLLALSARFGFASGRRDGVRLRRG